MLVDMHNHIINVSGIRSTNEDEAIQMIRAAVADGITHMIVTPPCQNNNYLMNATVIKHFVNKLNATLASLDLPMTVLEGMEIDMDKRLVSDLKGNILPLGGSNKYVYIRFPKGYIPLFTPTIFFDMQLQGFVPVIANAEMNEEIRRNPVTLRELVDKGALVHIGAASILGMNGKAARRMALKLCRMELVHLISTGSFNKGKKRSLLKAAYAHLEKRIPFEAVEYYKNNAKCIVKGTDFHS